MPAFGHRLAPPAVDAPRRGRLPAGALAGMSRPAAGEPRYLAGAAFVGAVAACIGRDLAGDHEPSIPGCAERRLA